MRRHVAAFDLNGWWSLGYRGKPSFLAQAGHAP